MTAQLSVYSKDQADAKFATHDEVGAGGAYRETLTYTTGELAPMDSEVVSVDLGQSYSLLELDSDVDCKVTLYVNESAYYNDTEPRTDEQPPPTSSGVLFEATVLGEGSALYLSGAVGYVLYGAPNQLKIVNRTGENQVITITLVHLITEVVA